MTASKTVSNQNQITVARRVDEIASSAMALFKTGGSFEAELAVAQAVSDLRAALTPEMMSPVMALMNTDLGFRTDRDPKLTAKDKEGNPLTPYPMEVVRECLIESLLRGFHTVGNEWNIIAGRFYACKNGFRRKVVQFAGVTDFKDTYDVPRTVGDKGALVKCRATWRKDGIADSLEREFPIRVNFGMGADAILGKAQRKLLAAVHDRLLGVITPEGEAGEEIEATATPKASPRFAEAQPNTSKAETPPAPTPQQQLAELVVSNGHTFDQFVRWGVETGNLTEPEAENLTCFDDLSAIKANRYIQAKAGLLRGLKLAQGGAR